MVIETPKRLNRRSASRSRNFGPPKISRERLWIVLISLLSIAAFVVTLQVSVAGSVRTKRPQLALMMAPFDAAARSRLASQLVASEETRETAGSLAKDAIVRDALQPVAFRVLSESLGGQASSLKAAEDLMRQSARLSRREVSTQMWFIEHFGRIGDAKQMVQHFDIALRTSESAWRTGFPMLALAAAEPQGEELVVKTLSDRPVWAKEFARYMTGSGTDLAFAARVAELLLETTDRDNRGHYLLLLRRLTEGGFHSRAWEIYGKLGFVDADAKMRLVRNGDFDGAEDGTPFDWTYAQEPELWAARERVDGQGFVLRLAAYNGRSGEVASQLIHLSPGVHRINLLMGDVPADRYDRPEFFLSCVGKTDAHLASVVSDTPGPRPQNLAASFIVPRECAFQRIVIRVSGEGPLNDSLPWIDDISIE